jgi:vacuolar iron transporter family protein
MLLTMEHDDHSPDAIRARLAAGPSVSYLRDWVYGGIDGSVTTFAVVSGVVGAMLAPRIILVLGAANLIADGFSMAASNYSGTRTEHQELDRLRALEEDHISRYPEGEREEVRQILIAKGFSEDETETMVRAITADRKRWIDFMLTEEYGAAQGKRSPLAAAWSTFAAFVLCGLVPLLPFALSMPGAFTISLAMTLAVFFAIGSIKSRWLLVSWWKAGLETLTIGTLAALFAYGIGALLR